MNTPGHYSYAPGHPWYYLLDGPVMKPSDICKAAQKSGYQGYRTDIDKADSAAEPKRSAMLRFIRAEVLSDLRRDLSRYRKVARELRSYRQETAAAPLPKICAEVHTAMSLKHNHLYNHFARMLRIDALLSYQGDLFDL